MSDEFRTSLARVAKIIGSWLKDTYIIIVVTAEVTESNNRKNLKKMPCISSRRTIMKQ